MKKFFILMAFIVSACGGQVSALSQNTDTEYRTPLPTATQSPVPTVTIEYQATAYVAETQAAIAKATADEARRIMVQATNDEAQRQHEKYLADTQGTQQVQGENFIRDTWTATAALTSIPSTQTAYVDNKTAIAAYNTVTVAQLTATAALPEQIVAAANAETQAMYAPVRYGVEIFALFGLGVFGLFGAWFMVWYWRQQDAREVARSPRGVAERDGFKPVQPVQPVQETIITVRQDLGDNNTRMDKYTVPCTRDQLLQVAENVLSQGWTLGINQWESAGTLFTRNTFGKLRTWLQVNRFAVSGGGGTLALSPEGRAFLESFLNTSNIPTEYQFGEVTQ